ncbi:MAG TPA: hypothetical protein VEC12_02240 [Bacteroidia bacterium]|nr:hypothetical protein [Bacteroidia bacterium]
MNPQRDRIKQGVTGEGQVVVGFVKIVTRLSVLAIRFLVNLNFRALLAHGIGVNFDGEMRSVI